MKKISSTRQPDERRKPNKNEAAAARHANAVRNHAKTHNRLADSYESVAGLHEAAVERLVQVTQLSDLTKNPEVQKNITPEAAAVLNEQMKIVNAGIATTYGKLKELTGELSALCPNSKVRMSNDEAIDHNANIISLGIKYGEVMETHEVVTMPAVNACLDIINATLPVEQRADLTGFRAEIDEISHGLDTEIEKSKETK